MALSKRSAALLAGFAGVACRALGAADSECAAGSPGCANDQDSLLQVASNARESNFFCNKNSLIIGPTADDTFLQWNLQLMSQGAPYAQFLNCTRIDDPSTSYGQMFAEDIALVNKRGKPNYGIVLVQCASDGNLVKSDSAKLKEYLDAGGLLVVSQSDSEQTTALLEDLGSSIRQENWPNEDSLDCGTAADPPYVPSKTSGGLGSKWCPKLVEGVTGMQGSNLDAVVDDTDSSVPLFAEQRNATYVVARAEKKRRLVVIGDDEAVDDDCATKDGIQALAFGVTTNLRFFSNLYNSRCMAFWN